MAVKRSSKFKVSRDIVVASTTTLLLICLSIAFGGSPNPVAPNDRRPPLRLAYFPNLTHAPALIGIANGTFQRRVARFRIESKVVNAGPEAMEALLAGEVDVAYVGPSPAVNTYLKSGGKALRILAGACSGGASLICRGDESITSVAGLDRKRVAVPQLGGTQDVSLRRFLSQNHLAPVDKGGSVEIIPVKNPDILGLFLARQIDAAWVPEPWASRLKADAHAKTVVDERDLWPNRTFTTTVVVARAAFLDADPDAVAQLLAAHEETVAWIASHQPEAKKVANGALRRLTGKPLPDRVIAEAWTRLRFTDDVGQESIVALSESARRAGYLKGSINLSSIFDTSALVVARRTVRKEASAR